MDLIAFQLIKFLPVSKGSRKFSIDRSDLVEYIIQRRKIL